MKYLRVRASGSNTSVTGERCLVLLGTDARLLPFPFRLQNAATLLLFNSHTYTRTMNSVDTAVYTIYKHSLNGFRTYRPLEILRTACLDVHILLRPNCRHLSGWLDSHHISNMLLV